MVIEMQVLAWNRHRHVILNGISTLPLLIIGSPTDYSTEDILRYETLSI
jgi:hypothetical protein